VLDPQRRLGSAHNVFTDGAAATLLVCDEARIEHAGEKIGAAEVLGIPMCKESLDLISLLTALRARQLFAIFIEGGGRTVSAFLEQDLLDRLQIAIAPLVTGAGRPGIRLPARDRIAECLRLSPRVFAMGDDILFDCDLRLARNSMAIEHPTTSALRRII
jgi:riboflavin biosynthesis pyrimidine reductase